MKYLILFCFLLVSCADLTTPEDWNKCQAICKNNDGVRYYYHALGVADTCRCNNELSVDPEDYKENENN